MSQQNKTQLQSAINTDLADNTTGAISAADIRNNFINATDSLLFNSGSQTFDGTLTATTLSTLGNLEVTGNSTIGGNTLITGSLTTSGSVVDFTDATAISGSTFSGSFVGDGSGLTLPSTSGTAKMFSGVFTEVTGGSPALALTTERNDFDSTSPLIASKLGAGYWQFTFSGGAFDLNSSNTVYSFQPTPANSTVSVGFYSADTQGGNTIQIYARDTTGAMADGLLDDVEFRITQFSS